MNNTRDSFFNGAPRLGSSRFRKGKVKKTKLSHKPSVTAGPVPGNAHLGTTTLNNFWVPDPVISGELVTDIDRNFKNNVEGKNNLQSALGT